MYMYCLCYFFSVIYLLLLELYERKYDYAGNKSSKRFSQYFHPNFNPKTFNPFKSALPN